MIANDAKMDLCTIFQRPVHRRHAFANLIFMYMRMTFISGQQRRHITTHTDSCAMCAIASWRCGETEHARRWRHQLSAWNLLFSLSLSHFLLIFCWPTFHCSTSLGVKGTAFSCSIVGYHLGRMYNQ